ncbi:putative methyltransferase [Ananas comosus]|uniref:Putative methyltransferase n=1 Tax=Ananas comosus TaxID=4615 RepID=A0A199UV63_ANACO|nr:putative methyltransferase [Ananas comosus]
MAELFVKQAAVYAEARPKYPTEWFSMLSALTPHHKLAWDAGTGNGQAAVSLAEHYEQVIATDVSAAQLQHAFPHPKVRYVHTPLSASDADILSALGGENSVDIITVAVAVHWFDLPRFYALARRALRKPGGIIAVWSYNYEIAPFEAALERFMHSALPYWDDRGKSVINAYEELPFPFESVGMGSEGKPLRLDMEHEMSFDGLIALLRSGSPVVTAKEKGVDLVSEEVVRELQAEWGDTSVVRKVTFKAFMLVGTPKLED